MKPPAELRATIARLRPKTRDLGLLDVFEALEGLLAKKRRRPNRRLYMRNLMREIRKRDRERRATGAS